MRDDAILIVDDDEDIRTAGKLLLKRHYSQVDTCADPGDIPSMLSDTSYAAILLDMNFGPGESSGEQGFYWLRKILEQDPDAVVVLITAHGGIDVAVEAMKQGATDFIAKPWQNEKVIATLSASVKLRQTRTKARHLQQATTLLNESTESQTVIGESPVIREVMDVIERAAPTDANVLLIGENGTGKEVAARLLHQQSLRADSIFMTVDLGAVSESLFESELFGHVKGAFTGAASDRIGRIHAADGGTLFLDEIGNLPLHLQSKLLTVLEQRKVQPVGATRTTDIDVRVIAATNLTREQLNDENRFRQDLLFRLNTVEIELPPLRQRAADIPPLVDYYANYFTRKYNKPMVTFSEGAMDAMTQYSWPGNIRALRHAIERAIILTTSEQITPDDLQLSAPERESTDAAAVDTNLNLERIERDAIQQALTRHRYNISHAAKELGLTRAALYRRMEKHGL